MDTSVEDSVKQLLSTAKPAPAIPTVISAFKEAFDKATHNYKTNCFYLKKAELSLRQHEEAIQKDEFPKTFSTITPFKAKESKDGSHKSLQAKFDACHAAYLKSLAEALSSDWKYKITEINKLLGRQGSISSGLASDLMGITQTLPGMSPTPRHLLSAYYPTATSEAEKQQHNKELAATLTVFVNSQEGLSKKAETELKTFLANGEEKRKEKEKEKFSEQKVMDTNHRLPPPLGKSGPGPIRTKRPQASNYYSIPEVSLSSSGQLPTLSLTYAHTTVSTSLTNQSNAPTAALAGFSQAKGNGREGKQKINRRLSKRIRSEIRLRKSEPMKLLLESNESDLMQGVTPVKIHNLSKCDLTEIQLKCLSFGIHFLPTPKPNKLHLRQAIAQFQRTMRLLWIFKDNKQILKKYHLKSEFTPLSTHSNPALELELQKLEKSLANGPSTIAKSNWPKQLSTSLKAILSDQQLLLITADKNLGYCLVDIDWYKTQCLAHLNNTNSYATQSQDWLAEDHGKNSMKTLFSQLKNLVLQFEGELEQNEVKFILELKDWSLMNFYITAKVHKTPVKGRPIVPTMTWMTHNLSVWLSDQLNPLLLEIPTILKDSTQLLYNLSHPELLNQCKLHRKELWLLSCDVEALYPSINIKRGLQLLEAFLDSIGYQPAARKQFILQAAEFVLNTMFIHFDSKIYLQTSGAAMGSSFVPPYANIFMHMLESQPVEHWENTKKLLIYRRFIDDIFMLFYGSEAEVAELLSDLNNMDPSIKLTHIKSQQSIDFLDLTIFRTRGLIQTKAFQKAMNPYTYLPWNSYHPVDMKKAFIKGEAIRYARLCSNISDFNKLLQLFSTRLTLRGYPQYFISKVLLTVFWTSRSQYLRPKVKNNNQSIPLLFKLQCNPAHCKKWVRKCLNEFSASVRRLNHLPDTMKKDIVICQMLPPKLHAQVLKTRKEKGL